MNLMKIQVKMTSKTLKCLSDYSEPISNNIYGLSNIDLITHLLIIKIKSSQTTVTCVTCQTEVSKSKYWLHVVCLECYTGS